jgi:hypothetical protein
MDISYSKQILFLFIFMVILIILIYVYNQINKKNICPKLPSTPTTTLCCYDNTRVDLVTVPITKLHIKTAYNCCCKGNFKNDYVDIQSGELNDFCNLQNCALNGVRALDFTVYSMNDKPVISASTTNEVDYKELYNSIDFNTGMQQVQRYFIYDSNASLTRDPLFLIFRIQSNMQSTYDSVASSLTQVFGVGNQFGNIIYNSPITADTTLQDLQNTGVVIIVQPYDMDKFNSSNLRTLSAHTLNPDGITSPCINRYSDNLNKLDSGIHFVYPNLKQGQSTNFDSTHPFTKKVTFIAMNFQTNDVNLKKYNAKFGNSSFILHEP